MSTSKLRLVTAATKSLGDVVLFVMKDIRTRNQEYQEIMKDNLNTQSFAVGAALDYIKNNEIKIGIVEVYYFRITTVETIKISIHCKRFERIQKWSSGHGKYARQAGMYSSLTNSIL